MTSCRGNTLPSVIPCSGVIASVGRNAGYVGISEFMVVLHWIANPTRGCYALAGVQLPDRCAGNVQFSSRRVPYNRGMSRLAKNFAKMLSALQQLQEELPAAHSLHNHSEDDHSEDMSR